MRTMKAISPVIATVIIVAVAIAISIAVALWLTSLTSTMGNVEELKIYSNYGTYNTTTNTATIILNVTNTGTKDVVIKEIRINEVPFPITTTAVSVSGDVKLSGNEIIVPQNGNGAIILSISAPSSYNVKPGGTASVILISSSGQHYRSMVQILSG